MADKKKTMYIETTIPSYATARASNDLIKSARQALTRMFWENDRNDYDLYISQYVIDECSRGDRDAAQKRLELIKGIKLLQPSESIDELAQIYQNLLKIPEKSKIDSFHLAISVLEEMDYLLTWNFTHIGIVAYTKLFKYNEVHELKTPFLVNPETLNTEETV
jgi:hypothetical protein